MPYTVEDFTNLVLLDGNMNVRLFFQNGALSTTQIKTNMDQLIDFYNKDSFGFYTVESLDNQEF